MSVYEDNIKKAIIIAFLGTFLYACSDEFHQLFIPDRTGRLLDVFIDMIGASLGILILSLIKNHKKQR